MKQLTYNIQQFFLQPLSPVTLGFFRIAVSVFALVQILVLLPDWMWFYGPNGLIPWELSEPLSLTNMPTLGNVHELLAWTKISATGVLYLVTATYILSLVGLLLGYKTHLMGFLALGMQGLLNTTNHFTAYGVETFTRIALFYCAVLPVGVSWSLDAINRTTTVPGYLITLSIRIIQLHLCIMYLACGIEKACGIQWWTGEAVWMAMQQDQFHTVDINWMARVPLLPKLFCWCTLIVEGLYPLGMLWKKSRRFWLPGIISMHLFIALFLGLHLFGGLMILLNITAFGKECFPRMFRLPTLKNWTSAYMQLAELGYAAREFDKR